ncbi:hypothetical protein LGL55_15870 [Clostridium tagluense]|uniref:hypothetical protein n=1 Tax=Clostridium tagluense TaxID=360422 RepID=UPI001CF2B44E|nr:hypothetical protein [Clostridium tagluense]MCB2312751.1 hypothetical protein [Clostridium tagluense]MCB2317517.1 hypothetical protein [Clostridium tagluense]MCB2322250.1 hypothetical protein [Clostridium tagluense]MCB2327256.1 hypothetical protein [Clostridium tagluense]MCB2332019.1 hypothetical protein [Clostridium tagluense]
MRKKRPLGIKLLGCLYILLSISIIVMIFTNPAKKFETSFKFGVSIISGNVQILIFAIISLIISYGYLKLKKWGYWAMIIYTICFLVVSNFTLSLLIANMIGSIIILAYTFSNRNYFLDKGLCE